MFSCTLASESSYYVICLPCCWLCLCLSQDLVRNLVLLSPWLQPLMTGGTEMMYFFCWIEVPCYLSTLLLVLCVLLHASIRYLVLLSPWLHPLMAGGTETKPVCSPYSPVFVHIYTLYICALLGEKPYLVSQNYQHKVKKHCVRLGECFTYISTNGMN